MTSFLKIQKKKVNIEFNLPLSTKRLLSSIFPLWLPTKPPLTPPPDPQLKPELPPLPSLPSFKYSTNNSKLVMSSVESSLDTNVKLDPSKVYTVTAVRLSSKNSNNSNGSSTYSLNSSNMLTRTRNRNGIERQEEEVEISYTNCTVSGHGSFGVVIKADLIKGGSGSVALKRTKIDRRFKVSTFN